jgi:hypothetical protein
VLWKKWYDVHLPILIFGDPSDYVSNQERGSIALALQLAMNEYIMEALMADASFPLRFHRKHPSKYM